MLAGGAADVAMFDPHEVRLSNLVNTYPALKTPVSEYLASNLDDTAAEGRLKNLAEGQLLGAGADLAIEGLSRALKVMRNARGQKSRGNASLTAAGPESGTHGQNTPTAVSGSPGAGMEIPNTTPNVDAATTEHLRGRTGVQLFDPGFPR